MREKIDLKDTTFVIPVRIDTIERLENLKIVTEYLLDHFSINIVLLESFYRDNGLLKCCLSSKIIRYYIEDNDPIFYRTKFLNILTKKISSPYVGIWDTDVIIQPQQLLNAINILREDKADFVFPYDGVFLEIGFENRNTFLKSKDISFLFSNLSKMFPLYGFHACGGGFLANVNSYKKAGMENENFYGWGPEDGERVKRWEILGMSVSRVKGPMFHLTHPRGVNSGMRSENDRKKGISEFLRICRMSKEELENEVLLWNR